MADPKWNEDNTEVTLTKDDYEVLKNSSTESFNKGFGKGREKERGDILKHFDGLIEIDPNDIEGSIKPHKQLLQDINAGKVPEAMKGKFESQDVVKNLQDSLSKKDEIIDKQKNDHEKFRRETLIDAKITALAANPEHAALNPEQVKLLFKSEYDIDLDAENKISIKKNGNTLVDEKANPRAIDVVFKDYANANKHLFKGEGNGGSGGSGNENPPSEITWDDLKTDDDKLNYMKKYGDAAYKNLMDRKVNSR